MSDKLHDARSFHVFMPGQFDDLPITLEAFRVYCHLARRADKTGKSFPSLAKIGAHCFRGSYPNSSEASLKAKAIAAIKELCAYGLIRKELYDEGEGYKHNNYFLTNSTEWKQAEEVETESCNVRKGRPGKTRAKRSVNQDNPVTPDNSVNGDNQTRLTGITASVNRTLPKGISNEGISNEGNPDLLCATDAAHVEGGSEEGKKSKKRSPSSDGYAVKKRWFDEIFCVNYPYRIQKGGGKTRQLGPAIKDAKSILEKIPVELIENGAMTEALRAMIRERLDEYRAENNGQNPPKIQPKGSEQWVWALPYIPDPVKWLKERRWMSDYVAAGEGEVAIAAEGGLVEDATTDRAMTPTKHFDLAREKGIAIAMTGGVVYLSNDASMTWGDFAAAYPVEKLQEMSDARAQIKASARN